MLNNELIGGYSDTQFTGELPRSVDLTLITDGTRDEFSGSRNVRWQTLVLMDRGVRKCEDPGPCILGTTLSANRYNAHKSRTS